MSEITSKKRPFSGPPDPFICERCQTEFTQKNNLYSHMRNIHHVDIVSGKQSCGMCDQTFHAMSQLHNHLKIVHDIKLKFTELTFHAEDEFLDWKRKIEKEDQSSFVKRSSSIKNDKKFSYYICHRSGTYKPRESRSRHLKVGGSIKIGCTCPAVIKVSSNPVNEAEIKIMYQAIHVGHEKEVGKLPLSKVEKLEFASLLSEGVPISKILDKTREEYKPSERYGLTTRKDLHNIRRDFHLETVLHKDDATSVDLMVRKMQNDESNPLLIYKPVGGEQLLNFPEINKNDFLLGIMNESQEKLLELYNHTIMIDSTHGMNQYGFHLTTLMVHDGNHEGLPIATLFSNKASTETMMAFFGAIKERIPNLKTSVIMTDDTPIYVNAWKYIFSDQPTHLLCSWHVTKNWNLNLNSKIKEKARKEEIKFKLNEMLSEIDKVTFHKMMDDFFIKYKDSEQNFMNYFQNNYLKRPQKWAYCYRVNLGVNTNMKLERWHRQLKYEESGGTVIKRLDKAITLVTNAVAKKLLSRIICSERGKLTKRVALIHNRHKSSLNMPEYNVIKMSNMFHVIKTVDGNIITYNIEKGNENCDCDIKCADCNICIHSMTCTCVDFCIRFVICKHIHFVCQNKGHNDTEMPDSPADSNLIIDEENIKVTEKDIIMPVVQKNDLGIDVARNSVINELQTLNKRLLECNSLDVLVYAKEKIRAINSYLDISQCPRLTDKLPEIAKAPSNKTIKKQRDIMSKKLKKL